MSSNQHPREKFGIVAAKRIIFDPQLVGLRVEVDGGAEVPGMGGATRESYTGVLTGRRMEYGEPPWPWLEIVVEVNLSSERKKVWCDESFVYLSTPGRRKDVSRGN